MFHKARPQPSALALLALAALSACAPTAFTGRSAKSDGVAFDYTLAPAAHSHHYRVALALKDTGTGAAIDDAGVAVNVTGPGIDGGDLVNLRHDPATGGTAYLGDVSMPQEGAYHLTFQVNRKAPAASAQAVFSTSPPTG